MNSKQENRGERRAILRGLLATTVAVAGILPLAPSLAADKVKVGLMLPYTGTYAALGNAITNGFFPGGLASLTHRFRARGAKKSVVAEAKHG